MNAPLTDQQLQQLLETGRPLSGGEHQQSAEQFARYEQVFAELAKDLPLQADADFSDRVVRQITPPRPVLAKRSLHGWLTLALVLWLMGGVILLVSFQKETAGLWSGLTSVWPFRNILLFSLGSLLVWQFLDWKLVREPSLRP